MAENIIETTQKKLAELYETSANAKIKLKAAKLAQHADSIKQARNTMINTDKKIKELKVKLKQLQKEAKKAAKGETSKFKRFAMWGTALIGAGIIGGTAVAIATRGSSESSDGSAAEPMKQAL